MRSSAVSLSAMRLPPQTCPFVAQCQARMQYALRERTAALVEQRWPPFTTTPWSRRRMRACRCAEVLRGSSYARAQFCERAIGLSNENRDLQAGRKFRCPIHRSKSRSNAHAAAKTVKSSNCAPHARGHRRRAAGARAHCVRGSGRYVTRARISRRSARPLAWHPKRSLRRRWNVPLAEQAPAAVGRRSWHPQPGHHWSEEGAVGRAQQRVLSLLARCARHAETFCYQKLGRPRNGRATLTVEAR